MRFLQFKRSSLAAVLTAMILSWTVLPLTALAATDPTNAGGFNLTLSPLPVNLVANPGQTVTTPLRVENTGNQTVRLKVSLMKFGALGSSGEPSLEDFSAKDDYKNWVTFSKTSFEAVPNVFNTITMTIKVPKDAAFGYYYAAVFSQDKGSSAPVPSQNKINGAVASLILLDVQAPGEKRQLSVTSFQASHKVYQYLPSTFSITVKNTGNIHVVPTGNIFVGRSATGNFIDTLDINSNQGNVLPGSSRTFGVDWDNGFPSYQVQRQNGQILSDKNGQPIKKLSWNLTNLNKLRFGKYIASMTLVYNNGKTDVPVNGQVTFYVIPWIPLLIILVILMLVGVGLWVMGRSLLRRARKVRRPSH